MGGTTEIPFFGYLERLTMAMMYYDTDKLKGKVTIELPKNTYERFEADFKNHLPNSDIKNILFGTYIYCFVSSSLD